MTVEHTEAAVATHVTFHAAMDDGLPQGTVYEVVPFDDMPRGPVDGYVYCYYHPGHGPEPHESTTRSGRFYFQHSQRRATPAQPPEPPPLVIPDDIAKLRTLKELKEGWAADRAREERSIQALWKWAELKGQCGAVDKIFINCGYPRRPFKYRVTVQALVAITERDLRGVFNNLTITALDATRTVSARFDTAMRLDEPTTEDDPVALFGEAELKRQLGEGFTNAKVTKVDRRQRSYDVE